VIVTEEVKKGRSGRDIGVSTREDGGGRRRRRMIS
jgi:hypothetical protein